MITDELNFFQVVNSKEFGASRLSLLFARKLGLDRLIHASDALKEEKILAFVVERLISPCSAFSGRFFLNAHLVEELLEQQQAIQKSLAVKHVDNHNAVLFPLFFCSQLQAVIFSSTEGCPFGVEVFTRQDEEISDHLTRLMHQYNLKKLAVIGHALDAKLEKISVIKSSEFTLDDLLTGSVLITTEADSESFPLVPLSSLYHLQVQVQKAFPPATFENQNCSFRAYLLLNLLSYYLQWHMTKALEKYIQKQGNENMREWTLWTVLERLKSIRIQTVKFEDTVVDDVKTCLDVEQIEILSIFGISVEQFNA